MYFVSALLCSFVYYLFKSPVINVNRLRAIQLSSLRAWEILNFNIILFMLMHYRVILIDNSDLGFIFFYALLSNDNNF